MAKRSTRNRGEPIQTPAANEPAVTITDTGVYQDWAIDPSHPDATAFVERLRDHSAAQQPRTERSSLQRLHALQTNLRATIVAATIPEGAAKLPKRWATITADVGNGVQTYICAAPAEAAIEEAASLLCSLDIFLADDPSERDAAIFLRGFDAGMTCEARNVRRWEQFTLAGKKCSGGGQRGGPHGAAITNEAHAELHADYQKRVDALMAGGLSYNAATNHVASDMVVSAKTVQRHTVNRSPRNRGRSR